MVPDVAIAGEEDDDNEARGGEVRAVEDDAISDADGEGVMTAEIVVEDIRGTRNVDVLGEEEDEAEADAPRLEDAKGSVTAEGDV